MNCSVALLGVSLFAAAPSLVDAEPLDILGLVDLESLLAAYPHDLETFEFGGPTAHFPGGTSIALSEQGEIEWIVVSPDGWPCRTFRFFIVRSYAQACPADLDEAQASSLAEAETILVNSYSEFVEGAGSSAGWTSMERRFELRASRLASTLQMDLFCGSHRGVDAYDESGEFTTPQGVEALSEYNLSLPIHILPGPVEHCYAGGEQ